MASSAIPKKTVALVIQRDGGFCMLRISPDCMGVATCADHRANRGSGGAGQRLNQPSNLIAACGICNGAKEEADMGLRLDLEKRGLRLPAHSTHKMSALRALVVPVLYPDGIEYHLLDNGTRKEVEDGSERSSLVRAT